MKRSLVLLLAFGVMVYTGVLFANGEHKHGETAGQSAPDETPKAEKYVCPVHSDVRSDKPGECPKCGMTLKKEVTQPEDHEHALDEKSAHEHDK